MLKLVINQKTFFYCEPAWYGGQFMRVISCKFEIDKYVGLYLETVLNGLSKKLLSRLVRDVDKTFLQMKNSLPVTDDGKIDFAWMSQFVKNRENDIIEKFFNKYQKNCFPNYLKFK